MGHQRMKGRNQKVPRISWKWKHNLPDPVEFNKDCVKWMFIAMSVYIRKKQRDLK
jgi:hypothetical protein